MSLISNIHVALAAVISGISPPVAGGRLYDIGAVPEEPTYPFVLFATFSSNREDDKGDGDDEHSGHGIEFNQTLEIIGRGDLGKKNVEEIMDRLYDVFHDRPVALSGGATMVTLAVEDQSIELDQDGKTVNGSMRLSGMAHH